MAQETFGNVEQVRDADGNTARPASDERLKDMLAYGHTSGTVDVVGGHTVELDASSWPADRLTILVDPDADADVTVEYRDDAGNTVVSRGPDDDDQYSSTDGSQVYVTAAVAAPWIAVVVEDTSGESANETAYSIQVI